MFWRMAGLSPASPVENILDKENFSLDDLLDEDEIIQECKALNGRLINFLREKTNIRQLIRYIVEEAPDDTDTQKIFKFPFVACEIFTCEVDIILKALVEDEELMDELFSFLHPEHSHSTLLAGYFSKVVVCLLLRKTTPLMNYIRAHQDIVGRLVDLIGITSIMEVLIRLIGSDEHVYTDSTQWLEDMNVLEMIVDKFSSSDSPEVHANAAETLCAITRNSPPGLASKISSPSFIERLFHHALEDSRPKSVLVNSLSVCISLLDPKRLTPGTYFMYTRQMDHVSRSPVNPETVQGMLESLGDLLKLLDISSEEHVLLTTYGKLKPPLGKHRLKIIEFISVLVGVSSEAAKKELIRLGAVKRIIELFFEYPYNNFLHHHVEHILTSCLESKNSEFIEHVLHDCNLIGRMIETEKNSTLAADTNKPTIPAEGKPAPRIGNIGHITCIANKLVQLANSNNVMHTFLQDNADWVDWQTNVLLKRNTLENVSQWACGRPTALQDRTRDSDDDDYQDRDFDVAALANNLSQAFRFGIYSNDEIDEARGSLERDDEDVYFDEESAEVVISSLRLGDDQESGSLFTNSNWFAFEDERIADEHLSGPVASPSPKVELHEIVEGSDEEALADTATSEIIEPEPTSDDNLLSKSSEDVRETETNDSDKPSESTDTRGNSDSAELPPTSISTDTSTAAQHPPLRLPNGGLQGQPDDKHPDQMVPPPATVDNSKLDSEVVPDPKPIDSGTISPPSVEVSNEDPSSVKPVPQAGTEGCSDTAEHEEKKK